VSPPNDTFDASIITTGDAGTNLRLDTNSLQETTTKAHVDPKLLTLCATPDCKDPDKTAIRIDEGTRKTVYVHLDEAIPNGNYSGAVNFALDESADTKPVEITLSRSRRSTRVLGFFLILLGVLVSFLASTVLRNYSAAAEALLPAERLRELAESRKAKLAECDVVSEAPVTTTALNDIIAGLAADNLRDKHYIPPMFASPFGTPALSTDAYTTFLQTESDRLRTLGYLIEHGLCAAAAVAYEKTNPDHVKARADALKNLDALGGDETKTITQLSTDIPGILQTYEQALVPEEAKDLAAPGPPEPIQGEPSTEQLHFRINLASAGAWLLAIVATVVTGYAVLIGSNFGFGTEMDLVKCFLWGLGVQVAGQQLAQLTPSSVTTGLGFKAPTT